MREICVGDPQDPNLFVEKISKRELPIDPLDAFDFAQVVTQAYAPHGFLGRLVDSMQYKPETEFWNDFDQYADQVIGQMRDKPYSVIFSKRFGSGRWIHELLMSAGLHEAEEQFTAVRYRFNDDISQTLGLHDYDEIEIFHPEGQTIFIPEDFSLTGAQLGDMLNIAQPHSEDINVALMYATGKVKRLVSRSKMLFNPEQVRFMSETMTNPDIQFMQDLNDSYGWSKVNWLHDEPFFWTWYKVLDNVHDIFTEEAPHPLIRNGRFNPPYLREE